MDIELEILNQSAGEMNFTNGNLCNLLAALEEYYDHIDQSEAEHMKGVAALKEKIAARIEANLNIDLRRKKFQEYLFLKDWILENHFAKYSAAFNGEKAFIPLSKICDGFTLQYPVVMPNRLKKNLEKLCFYSSLWQKGFRFEMKPMNEIAAKNLQISLVEIGGIKYGSLVVIKQ